MAMLDKLTLFGHADMSGKFRVTGTVVSLHTQDFLTIATVLVGQEVVKVVVDEDASTVEVWQRVAVDEEASTVEVWGRVVCNVIAS